MKDSTSRRAANTIRKQRRHRLDYQIILYTGAVMLLGLVIIYAIGPQRAEALNANYATDFYTSSYFVIRQALSLAVALIAMIAMIFIPLEFIKRYAGVIFLTGVVASVLLALLGNILHVDSIANCTLGACRWFDLGPIGFQPAELLKFGVLVFIAKFIAAKISADKLNDWQETLWPIIAAVGIAGFFVIVLQRDMGTGIALFSIVASMLTIAGINRKNGVQLLAGLLAVGVLLILVAPHRIARVMTFLQGDDASTLATADGADYHTQQARIALGVGHVFGVGVGNSVQATGYLPEAINDSVFAIIGETFGFVGAVAVILLFAALLLRILSMTDRLHDPWLRMLAAGVFGWLGAHVVLNIASMVGVFPLTGITLPLLSFGGTSMMFVALAIGVVLHVSRYTSHDIVKEEVATNANIRSRRRVGRSRYAHSSRN